MSNENNNEALDLINEINRIHMELSNALDNQDHYDDSHNVFWFDEEVSLRKRLKKIELELTILNNIVSPTHRVFITPLGFGDCTELAMEGSEDECKEYSSCTPNTFIVEINDSK